MIINGIHPSRTSTSDIRAILDGIGLRVAPGHLTYRNVHKIAATQGRSPVEIEPHGKAGREIELLYEFSVACRDARMATRMDNHKSSNVHAGHQAHV